MISNLYQFIEVDNKEVYCDLLLVKGVNSNLPTIVLLHDSLGCVELWRDFPRQLSSELTMNVLVYDRMGYGKSQALDTSQRSKNYLEQEAHFLNKLLDKLAIKKVCLVGYSDGGSIALLYGALYSHRIDSLVCAAGHIFVEDITLKGIKNSKEYFQNSNLALRLEKYHGSKVGTLLDAWIQTWTHSSYRDWSIEHLMSRISCPVLFLQGDMDEYGTLEQVTKTLDKVQGIKQMEILSNTTHALFKEKPQEVLCLISNFINKYSKGVL